MQAGWRRYHLRFLACGLLLCSLLCHAHDPLSQDNSCRLRLATTDYPPYSSAQLPAGGAMNMAVEQMFLKVGCLVSIDTLPWARVFVEKEHYDAIMLLWPREVESMGLLGYQPLFTSRLGFFALGMVDVSSLARLKSLRIGITRGYGYPRRLLDAGLMLEEANDDLSNLRKLLAGRIDLVALERASGSFLIRQEFHLAGNRINWQEPAFTEIPLGIAVVAKRPGSADMVKRLARATELLKSSGDLKQIARQYNVDLYPTTMPR